MFLTSKTLWLTQNAEVSSHRLQSHSWRRLTQRAWSTSTGTAWLICFLLCRIGQRARYSTKSIFAVSSCRSPILWRNQALKVSIASAWCNTTIFPRSRTSTFFSLQILTEMTWSTWYTSMMKLASTLLSSTICLRVRTRSGDCLLTKIIQTLILMISSHRYRFRGIFVQLPIGQ